MREAAQYLGLLFNRLTMPKKAEPAPKKPSAGMGDIYATMLTQKQREEEAAREQQAGAPPGVPKNAQWTQGRNAGGPITRKK